MKLLFDEYKKPGAKVDISIVPLIDIMFLLVIFFMVTTVFPEEDGQTIRKPKMETAAKIEGETIKVRVNKEGTYFIGGSQVTPAEAEETVRNALIADPAKTVIVETDKDARVEILTEALDRLKKAGATSLAIAAERK